MTLHPADLFHAGFVVDDLDAAIARLTRTGTTAWTPPKEHALSTVVGEEPLEAHFRYAYSAEGPLHIELIEPLEPGYYTTTGPMTFHHFGYWVDDLTESVAASPGWGLSLECAVLEPDGHPKVTYHLDSGGLRHELVPRRQAAAMEERWSSARQERR